MQLVAASRASPLDVYGGRFIFGTMHYDYGVLVMVPGLQQCIAMFVHLFAVGLYSQLMAHVPWALGAVFVLLSQVFYKWALLAVHSHVLD